MKTILEPSGDHCGATLSAWYAVASVSGVRPVPLALMRQMLKAAFGASVPSSLREELKIILEPSGDHCGIQPPAPFAMALVSGVRPVPSALARQIFLVRLTLGASVPSRLRVEVKTILELSGDHCAAVLSAPAAMALVSGVRPVPSAFARQML